MQFNSFQYFIFLFVTVSVYYILPFKSRKILLLFTSFAFYMAWNTKYILLMLSVIATTYLAARLIHDFSKYKNIILQIGLIFNIGLLFYFKYFTFFIQSINSLFKAQFNALNILLPVGISFYIFQAIGYMIDVYQDDKAYEKSILNYALFISFFPQLVAGPIERSQNMLKQFNEKQEFRIDNIKNGITLILAGLVQKVIIADRLAIFVNGVFADYTNASSFVLITAVVFFAFQVYCDFSAYSLIAIGSAKMMGYKLVNNFNRPYLSRSFAEYWSRWHISLSTWFQDYIFMPFVWTNPLKKISNKFQKAPIIAGLFLVFLISGFWHGASWTFVVWGLLHAFFRILETLTAKSKKKMFKKLKISPKNFSVKLMDILITFSLNCVTYIFFRATSISQAMDYIKRVFLNTATKDLTMFSFGLSKGEIILSFLLIISLVIFEIIAEVRKSNQGFDNYLENKSVLFQSAIYATIFLALVTIGIYGTTYAENPFIYFQF